jgi:hypothetical protein
MDLGRTLTTSSVTTAFASARAPSFGGDPYVDNDQKSNADWKPIFCEQVSRHDHCQEVVVLKVLNGPRGANKLFAVFDRTLLDYRTPFLARIRDDGTIEVSTLNGQLRIPSEIRFTAYTSLASLPQPYRDQTMSVPGTPPDKSTPSVIGQLASRFDVSPVPKTKASSDIKVRIEHRHRHPIREKLRLKKSNITQPQAEAALSLPNAPAAKLSRASPMAKHERSGKSRTASGTATLTTMAVAFQKLAASDPEIEDILIAGFQKKPDAR